MLTTVKCVLGCAVVFVFSVSTRAQDPCACYRLVPRTVYEQQQVTTYRWVNETVYETQQVTSYKPVWTTENRERRYTVLKPVVETSEREERYTVYKPVVETSYVEQTYEETSWETVTETREDTVVVQKPVVETQYRQEQITVRKPVVETMMQTENVTTYRPVTTSQTVYYQGTQAVNQMVYQPGVTRNRLQWLSPGCYVDPTTGQTVYKRAGLHWVPSTGPGDWQMQTALMPTLIPQEVQSTQLVAETTAVQRPVQVTRYVDEIQTRQIPVQVQRMEQEIQTRQYPVTVQRPVTRQVVQKVPVENIRYEKQEVVRKVPVTQTTYQREERVEPYQVQVCRWQTETREVQVPKVVSRCVPVQTTQLVPRTVVMRVAIDPWGNPVYTAPPTYVSRPVITGAVPETGTTTLLPVTPAEQPEPEPEKQDDTGGQQEEADKKPALSEQDREALLNSPDNADNGNAQPQDGQSGETGGNNDT